MKANPITSKWRRHGHAIYAESGVQKSLQINGDQETIVVHPIECLVLYAGTIELAEHLTNLHNRSIEVLEIMGGNRQP
jgi:hypothetical protein